MDGGTLEWVRAVAAGPRAASGGRLGRAWVVRGIRSVERSTLRVSCAGAAPPRNVRKPFRAGGCLRAQCVVLLDSPVGDAGLLKRPSPVALLCSSSRANAGPSSPRAVLR